MLGFRDGERTEAQSNGNRGTTRAIQVESGRVPSLRSTGTRTTRLGGWRIPNPSLSTQTQRENDPHDTTSLRPPHERSGEATRGATSTGSDELTGGLTDKLIDGLSRRTKRKRTCRNTSVEGRWRATWTLPSASHGRISRTARNLGAGKAKGKDEGRPRVEETREKRE